MFELNMANFRHCWGVQLISFRPVYRLPNTKNYKTPTEQEAKPEANQLPFADFIVLAFWPDFVSVDAIFRWFLLLKVGTLIMKMTVVHCRRLWRHPSKSKICPQCCDDDAMIIKRARLCATTAIYND